MRFLRPISLVALVWMVNGPLPSGAQPQDVQFEHFTTEDGLATNAVNTMLQDSKGFLWFGTDAGLHRYDGYHFTLYQADPDDPHSLSSDQVLALYEDREDGLWVGTAGGLHRFDRATEQFTSYRHDPNKPFSLSDDVVSVLREDRQGVLWVGTGEGLNRFDRATERFTSYRHDPGDPRSLSSNRVTVIYEDQSGALWIGTGETGVLHRFDRDAEAFTRYLVHDLTASSPAAPASPPASFSDRAVHALYEDREGVFWIGTWRAGLYRFDRDRQTVTHYRHDPDDPGSLGSNYISVIEEDPNGMLWLGSVVGLAPWGSHGLTRYDPRSDTFTRISFDPTDPDGFHGRWVRAITVDRAGTLWVATSDNGINKLDLSTRRFTIYPYTPHDERNLQPDGVWAISESRDGALWIGTDEGLDRVDRATGRLTHYAHDPNDPGSLSHLQVKCLLEDRDGVLWVGTWGGGLNRFDRETETFTHYRHDPNDPTSLSSDLVDGLLEDRDGVLWVGTWSGPAGLNRFDRETETFTRYAHDPHDSTSISSNFVSALLEDRQGALWMGVEGLSRLDRTTGQFTRYLQDELVYTVYEDPAGRLWAGGNRGVYLVDGERGTVASFNRKIGLPQPASVMGIVGDEHGNLWIAKNGIIRFDPETGAVRTYGLADGLPSLVFNRTAYAQSARGELFLGSDGGVVAFYPEHVRDNAYVPPIVLTDFSLTGASASAEEGAPLQVHVSAAESITLSYNQNDVTFAFAALNFRNAEKNRYAYRLEGYDNAWREVGTQRTATYINLPPGTYRFRVKGSNDDGLWNEEGATIRLTITPPFWKRWWFYGLCIGAFLAVMVGSYRLRVRHLKQRQHELARQVHARTRELALEKQKTEAQAEKLQEMDHLKSRFFTNISHEFRTPLTLILGPLHDALVGADGTLGKQQLRMMQRNGLRLQRLINQLLDLSKLEAGRMPLHARPRNVTAFLRGLVQSFASLAERRHITLQYHAEDETLLLYFDADKLEKVISNLLSNAFKFTPAGGRIRVDVRDVEDEKGQAVGIRVQDTGPGIPAEELPYIFDRFHQVNGSATREHEGTGIGLTLAKELVERHGGTISAESKVDAGTTITIWLPQGKAHLAPEDLIEEKEAEAPDGATPPAGSWPAAAEESRDDGRRAAPPSHAPIVLIVEDNADVREYLKSHLVALYRVEEAADGVEGLEKTRALRPDLVISDVMMPRMDGYALCRAIKTARPLSHIPVVLLTARADEESTVEGLETGADDYLHKPFSAAELLVRVENLIEIRRVLRQRFSRGVVLRPADVYVSSEEEAFIEQVRAVIEVEMANSAFTVDVLADAMALSPRQLQRKLRALTRLSPSGLIRSMRLERAAQLLEQRAGNVSDVALAVGFRDAKYFSRLFRQAFGVLPSEYSTPRLGEGPSAEASSERARSDD